MGESMDEAILISSLGITRKSSVMQISTNTYDWGVVSGLLNSFLEGNEIPWDNCKYGKSQNYHPKNIISHIVITNNSVNRQESLQMINSEP